MSSLRRSRALCGAISLKVTKQALLELRKCSMKLRDFLFDLQAVLASKLNAGSTEQQSEALMHGILLCERFMANAQGTEAELEVLKQEVKKVLSGQVGCTASAVRHGRRFQCNNCFTAGCKAESQEGSTESS